MVSTTFPSSLTALTALFVQSSYLVQSDCNCNCSLFPSNRTTSALQRSLFVNKHILDPGQARNRDFLHWTSDEWSKWLVERNTQDGILRGNHYGTILKGRNISVIIGAAALILRSLKEFNTTTLESSFGTRQLHIYTTTSRNFTVYHFVRLRKHQDQDEDLLQKGTLSNFVEYELFKLCNASFWIIKTIFGKERETVQLSVSADKDVMKENFVIRVHFTMKKFDTLPAEAVQSIVLRHEQQLPLVMGINEQAFLAAAHGLLYEYPDIFVRNRTQLKDKPEALNLARSGSGSFFFSKEWGHIMSSIAGVRGEALSRRLSQMTHLEKYVIFEIVKTARGVTGRWSKFRLLSMISKSLAMESLSGIANTSPFHSVPKFGLLGCYYISILVISIILSPIIQL